MATMKLTNIADRQRTYLVRDILFAVLVAIILAIQVSAFTTARPALNGEVMGVHVTRQGDQSRVEALVLPIPVASSAQQCADSPLC